MLKSPSNRMWQTVPVEVEPTPEGQLRQHMNMVENGTRYDYINFTGGAALLHRTIRSTLAHLHVALGHVTNEKLQRMLHLNGAQPEIIEAVKHLKCQICSQVAAPMATPKAAFQRPMAFNERIVADTFYVWDAKNEKFAVTHVLDAFSLYQIAMAMKDPSADNTTQLLRDRWIGVFGPPNILMTDQGTEFRGVLEPLLKTFAVFHEMVPPTAHWRMSLAERHGAVLKVLLMKVIKETVVTGLEDLQSAVASVTASRNQQVRVAGYSPIQLVFGRDSTMPGNLMDALAGQMKFQLSRPTSVEESFMRSAQLRKAAADAFQWMEANEALKRAAGSRSRLPKLELLAEGAQVMFWEPPANRRGLSRRLQDNISWIGPGLVVALERKDGAIKRVWVRYQNKLKGMPLEFIRLAVVEEQEASSIAKEALEDMEKQLAEGRVNAEEVEKSSSSSSSTSSDEEQDQRRPQKSSAQASTSKSHTVKGQAEHTGDPQFPPAEFSDEEQEGVAPVSEHQVRSASSVLDDVPISIYRKQVPSQQEQSSRPQKKVRLSGLRGDPALKSFSERRAVFDGAMDKTQKHLQRMREKLQPRSVQVSMPTPSGSSAEQVKISTWDDEPPFVDVHRFYNPEYSDSDENMAEALAVSIDTNVLATLPVRDHDDLQIPPFDMPSDFENDGGVEEVERSVLHRDTRLLNPRPGFLATHSMPATPQTRMRLPPTMAPMLREVPSRMRRPLKREEFEPILRSQRAEPPPSKDYWILSVEEGELCRVHVEPRLHMFDILAFYADNEEGAHQDFPKLISKDWLTGVRATQVYYLHNPLRWGQARTMAATSNNMLDPFYQRAPALMMNDFILDNVTWVGQGLRPQWNTQQHLGGIWQGLTRYQIRDPTEYKTPFDNWMKGRHHAEQMWRDGQKAVHAFVAIRETAGWPNSEMMAQQVGPLDMPEVQEEIQRLSDAAADINVVQKELQEVFFNFVHFSDLPCPSQKSQYAGIKELVDDPEDLPDAQQPETGKVRLELKWSDLSPAWQRAFEQPILDALEVYFKHDALTHVMEDEVVDRTEVLPSRFVLVNKSDPRNIHPDDKALEGASLKARLVIAGHRDVRAGEYETESPTASLLAHNLLCFCAAQWSWKVFFSDISAAFLQGDYLPAERRVFVQTPKNYPLFVRRFLQSKIPAGARTDLFRMKKAGFGLAESPRLWYHRFKRGAESIGGREMKLCPGVFSFFGPDSQLRALLAVHVDDVRLIAHPDQQQAMHEKLNALFSFGEWKHPDDWTKFCGRYEKQLENGTVLMQMDSYAERLLDPPLRSSTQQRYPLQPNEKKWIGTITGQLNWMARQCRADLSFGVSRIQQLAGVNDPSALTELKILVDRARQPVTIKFEHLGCDMSEMIVVAVSDASFAGMPRGRSQGGLAVAFANPKILEGQSKLCIVIHHSGLLKRVVRSSLAAEISQAANALEEADFTRALLAEVLKPDFSLANWLAVAAMWKLVLVLDSRTGYDLLNGTALGEDKRLAIDIAALKQSLAEDAGGRLIRWVPGEELIADDLTKLCGNQKLMNALMTATWALRDTEVARKLRADAAARKRTYRQRVSANRAFMEQMRIQR